MLQLPLHKIQQQYDNPTPNNVPPQARRDTERDRDSLPIAPPPTYRVERDGHDNNDKDNDHDNDDSSYDYSDEGQYGSESDEFSSAIPRTNGSDSGSKRQATVSGHSHRDTPATPQERHRTGKVYELLCVYLFIVIVSLSLSLCL